MRIGLVFSLSLCSFLLILDASNGGGLNNFKKSRSKMKTPFDSSSISFDPTRVTELSSTPRAYFYKGFLSYYECDHLINLARNKLKKSHVVDDETGESVPSEFRTSSGMFLDKAQDGVVAKIEQRIAAWTLLPIENGEGMHVLRYEVGQKYDPHFDYFKDKFNIELGGHRYVTVLMYLTNVEKGGETVFPDAEGIDQPKDDSFSECAKQGFAVKPSKGDALLFFSLHPNATTDTRSLHGSCPVIKGEKWSATKWIHVQSYEQRAAWNVECVDENPNCAKWAIAGECERSPDYMIGDEEFVGSCRRSCKVC